MNFCSYCVTPDTRPDLRFDNKGVCDACHSYLKKRQLCDNAIDWHKRETEFKTLIQSYCRKDPLQYDCVIPVSGGKDSHYSLHIAKVKYGLNPLCVYFEPTLLTEIGRENLENISRLGVDIIHFKRNPVIYEKLVLEGLRRVGDNEWVNHQGIWTYPVQIAIKFNIPLIFWGESPQLEYGGAETVSDINKRIFNEDWLNDYGCLNGLRPQDLVSEELDIKLSDLKPYIYPSKEQVSDWGGMGVFLGYYFQWNDDNQLKTVEDMGFKRRKGRIEVSYTDYEKLDCLSMNIHDYLKYLKYGYGRATDSASRDIRNGLIDRAQGVRLVEKYDASFPKEIIETFCEYFAMPLMEFQTICDHFINRAIFETDAKGNFKRDIDGSLVMKEKFIQRRRNAGKLVNNTTATLESII